MALNYVTLILDLYDGSGAPISQGSVLFTPSAQLTDATDQQDITQAPVSAFFRAGISSPQVTLLATDNANLAPSGWGWNVAFQNVPGNPQPFSFLLPHANGATQYLSAVQVVESPATMQAYVPIPSGTAVVGNVPTVAGINPLAWVWNTPSGGGGAVSSVFGRTGAVVANTGDYTAAQVGADASGAATTAQSNAETYAAGIVATETARAETAEALLAPKASPALTGTPTAPTASALTSNTQVATTAYADSAVAVETSRAEAAEALARRSVTLIVAASNATASSKYMADYACTGTNDDVQINAAFAALPSYGGGVYLTEGNFSISNPLVPVVSNTHLKGPGLDACKVSAANGSNSNGFAFTSSTKSLIFCSVEGISFYGNSTFGGSGGTNTSGYGVYINPSGQTFWDFHLRDVFFSGWEQDGFYSYDGHGYVLDHVLAETNGGWGINFPTSGGGQPEVRNGTVKFNGGGGVQMAISGGVVAECEVSNNTGYGIALIGPACARDNTVYSNSLAGIVLNSNSTLGTRASGNVVYSNTQYGILALTSASFITGNWLQGNSAGTNTYDEIQVQRGFSVVAFNWVNGQSQSRYGINFNGGNTFSGNVCNGNQVENEHTALYYFGTTANAKARDNLGFNPVGVVTPAVPASGSPTTAQVYDQTFYITAGASTVTCAISGGPSPVIPSGGFGTIRVPATQTLTPTYSSAPTWVVEGE